MGADEQRADRQVEIDLEDQGKLKPKSAEGKSYKNDG